MRDPGQRTTSHMSPRIRYRLGRHRHSGGGLSLPRLRSGPRAVVSIRSGRLSPCARRPCCGISIAVSEQAETAWLAGRPSRNIKKDNRPRSPAQSDQPGLSVGGLISVSVDSPRNHAPTALPREPDRSRTPSPGITSRPERPASRARTGHRVDTEVAPVPAVPKATAEGIRPRVR